ncbi:MAG: F0F1 ATP synthase subunit gamma, partial [Rhodospirillaceae bacterium]|nr:F0F1 ATP synthase subunit gamma [Rhodospirillaceae bacterium]
MASLKDLRVRINSVRQTQKITSAMKLVAASKLRRAQESAEAARPFSERMERMVGSLAEIMGDREDAPAMLRGTGKDDVHLFVVATADRGLCGGFNSSITRATRARLKELAEQGKTTKIICVGRKGREQLRREFGGMIIDHVDGIGRTGGPTFEEADSIGRGLTTRFEEGEFDTCTVVYNRFKTVMSQVVTFQQLIPFSPPEQAAAEGGDDSGAIYDFEPDEEMILSDLLPRNLSIQIFRSLLENAASEQGARMTAMD